MDTHHRRAHTHPGDLGFEFAFEFAGVMRHVGRGAAHVETDHPIVPGQRGSARHADDAAGGTAENRVLSGECVGIGEPAAGLHEQQWHSWHLGGHLLDIAAQDGRQVRVNHRGVATADKFHQRAGLMRGADLFKAKLAGDTHCSGLVRGVTVAMHKDDRHAAKTLRVLRAQLFAQQRLVERQHQLTVRTDALVRLDNGAVQQLGKHDAPVEQARAVLVRDAQRIAKTAGGDQQRRLALALKERVGRHRGTHLDAFHPVWRHLRVRPQAQQIADAGNRGVAVLLRVVAQQLVRDQATIGLAAHDVGEGAAAVDPELPAR